MLKPYTKYMESFTQKETEVVRSQIVRDQVYLKLLVRTRVVNELCFIQFKVKRVKVLQNPETC